MAAICTEEAIEAALLPLRVYRAGPAGYGAPLVLHLHGGAFTEGSLDTGRTVSRLLAEAGAVVFSADYPLAPEQPFPRALQAAFEALHWLYQGRAKWVSRKSRVFVAGEEAGGNLAAGLALMARDQHGPPVAGQILISPMLDPLLATCSLRRAEAGAVGCKWAYGWHQYLGSAEKASHPYAAPSGASRLAGLAPALILTAEDDPMRDESLVYARCLRQSGVAVREHVLAAPTGWPQSLCRLANDEPAWAASIRNDFTLFLAEPGASRSPAPPRLDQP